MPCCAARTDQAEAEDTVQKSKWVRKPKSLQSQAAEIETAVPCNDKKEHPVFGKLLRQARLHISRIRCDCSQTLNSHWKIPSFAASQGGLTPHSVVCGVFANIEPLEHRKGC